MIFSGAERLKVILAILGLVGAMQKMNGMLETVMECAVPFGSLETLMIMWECALNPS